MTVLLAFTWISALGLLGLLAAVHAWRPAWFLRVAAHGALLCTVLTVAALACLPGQHP